MKEEGDSPEIENPIIAKLDHCLQLIETLTSYTVPIAGQNMSKLVLHQMLPTMNAGEHVILQYHSDNDGFDLSLQINGIPVAYLGKWAWETP